MTENKPTNFPTYEEIREYVAKVGDADIESYTRQIQDLPSPLREEFIHWWHTGELNSTVEVHGVTVQSVVKKKRADTAIAFADFAGLYLDPDDDILHTFLTYNSGFPFI